MIQLIQLKRNLFPRIIWVQKSYTENKSQQIAKAIIENCKPLTTLVLTKEEKQNHVKSKEIL